MFRIDLTIGGKLSPFQSFIMHIAIAVLVTGAAIALAVHGNIDGATAVGMIGVGVGVPLGSAVSTSGSSTSAAVAAQTASQTAVAVHEATIAATSAAVKIVPAPGSSPSSAATP